MCGHDCRLEHSAVVIISADSESEEARRRRERPGPEPSKFQEGAVALAGLTRAAHALIMTKDGLLRGSTLMTQRCRSRPADRPLSRQ